MFHTDDSLNLDTLLLQISSQVTPVWYKFGQVIGVSKEILDKCLDYPAEECVVEVVDHWLRTRKCTWKDVAEGLNATGLQCLADDILKVYTTGNNVTLHWSLFLDSNCRVPFSNRS